MDTAPITHDELEQVEGLLKDAQGTHCAHGSPKWQAAQRMRDAIIEGRVQIVARVP